MWPTKTSKVSDTWRMGCIHMGGRGRREGHSRDLYPLHNLPDWLPSASGIQNISNQIKVAENTPDLSGLAGGSARVKRLRLQCLSEV